MNVRFVVAIGVAVVVAAAGYGLYTFGMNRGMQMAATAAAPPDPGRRVLYWHDPMVPGKKFDKPGKSPFMDMELVPVYADEASGEAPAVRIDPSVQQNLGVRTAVAETVRLGQPAVEAVGSVAYNERDMAVVQARANGYVEKLHVRAMLDRVTAGQPLADVYVPDWVAAQEDFLAVRRLGAQAPAGLLDAARQRMRLAGMSDAQVALVERDGRAHPRLSLVAPIAGVVSELTAREGMTVMNGAPLFRINGLATVWVNAEVPENAAASVRPGAPAQVRTAAYPDEVFTGKVSAILPEVDPATRTLKARVEVANAGGKLVPGMFARVAFATPDQREALTVPSEAVIRTGKRNIVMVAGGEGRFKPVEVELGMESGGRSEIRKGLAEGDRVVASGQFLVDSEASLKGVELRAPEPKAAGGKKAAP
jgi:Cu(I)/Ag(I) efflux system membrane fusion protein